MSPPLFFVLHDVGANTYSRDLIPNPGLRNLRRLFEVVPRSYNRSKAACDRAGVMLVRFKHATPLAGIHMVPWRRASRGVRSAVRCVENDHDAALVAVDAGGRLRAGGMSRNVALAGVGLGALAAAATLHSRALKIKMEEREREREKERKLEEEKLKEKIQQDIERERERQIKEAEETQQREGEDIIHRLQENEKTVKIPNMEKAVAVLKQVSTDAVVAEPDASQDRAALTAFQKDFKWKNATFSLGYPDVGLPSALVATFADTSDDAEQAQYNTATLFELQNEIKCLSNPSLKTITPLLVRASVWLQPNITEPKTISDIALNDIASYSYVISGINEDLFSYLFREFVGVTRDNLSSDCRLEQWFVNGGHTNRYVDELKDIANMIYTILVTLDEHGIIHGDLSLENFGVRFDSSKARKVNGVVTQKIIDTILIRNFGAATDDDSIDAGNNNVLRFCTKQFSMYTKLTQKARDSNVEVDFTPLLLLVRELGDKVEEQKAEEEEGESIYVFPNGGSYKYRDVYTYVGGARNDIPDLLSEEMKQKFQKQQTLNDEALKKIKSMATTERSPDGKPRLFETGTLIKVNQYSSVGKFYNFPNNDLNFIIKEYKAACHPFLVEFTCLKKIVHECNDNVPIAPVTLNDYYFCDESTSFREATNKDMTCGYKLRKFEYTLDDYLGYDTPLQQEETPWAIIETIGTRLFHILTRLDELNIYHRNLRLLDFVYEVSWSQWMITNFENAMIYDQDKGREFPEPYSDVSCPTDPNASLRSNVVCFLSTLSKEKRSGVQNFRHQLFETVSRLNTESNPQVIVVADDE